MTAVAPSPGALADDSPLLVARRLLGRGQVHRAVDLLTTTAADPALAEIVAEHRVALLAMLLEGHLALGDLAAATAIGQELAERAHAVDDPHAALALHARGELAAALDDAQGAADLFLAAGEAGGDAVRPVLAWRSAAALALVRLGRRREGLELAQAHHAHVQTVGTGHDLAVALRALAAVETDGRRTERLREARDLLTFGESERLCAQIDTDLAGLLLLGGEAEKAVALLRDVEAFAGRQDLWPLQSRVRRLLERLGETPRRMEFEALAVLTVAERRVTLAALDGLPNKGIAEQLGVSVKAVEGHLSKVYRKLGISSRAALNATVSRRE